MMIKIKPWLYTFLPTMNFWPIEMMAGAIIKFAHTVNSSEFKKISIGILSAIKDEQKHFKLYSLGLMN